MKTKEASKPLYYHVYSTSLAVHHGFYLHHADGTVEGDCVEFNAKYPDCTVTSPNYIGDGECDDYLSYKNTAECGWDGGYCLPILLLKYAD